MLYSKFNLTTKKRMLRVSCDRLERCAALALAFLVADSTLFFQALLDAARADDSSATVAAASSSSSGSSSGGAGVPSLDHYRGALARDDVCWPAVWRVVGTMETVELDKQLLINLRDARTVCAPQPSPSLPSQRKPATHLPVVAQVLTGDVLDHACQLVQAAAGRGGSGSGSSSSSSLADRRMLDLSRIRTVLKVTFVVPAVFPYRPPLTPHSRVSPPLLYAGPGADRGTPQPDPRVPGHLRGPAH